MNTFFDKDDVLTARISMLEPFEMFMRDPWDWISDGALNNWDEYHLLDSISAFLVGDIIREELPEKLQALSIEELKAEYSKRFPILFGKALQVLGNQMENDEIRLDIEYPLHNECN